MSSDSPVSEFNKIINETDKPVFVLFGATWCSPCVNITPAFRDHSERTTDIVFIKVDIDDNRELSAHFGINAIPHMKVFLDGKEIETVSKGMNHAKLNDTVNKYLKVAKERSSFSS